MQIKGLISIAFCIVCGLLCISAYLLVKKSEDYVSLYQKKELQRVNSETFEKVILRNSNAAISSDDRLLHKDSILCTVYQNKRSFLNSQLLAGKVVLFVPKKSCNVCYDEIYEALKYAKDSLDLRVKIVTEQEKYNEVRNIIFDLDLGEEGNVLYLKNDAFWNSIAIVYAPFLAYLNENLRTYHSFIPIPNHPEYSYEYLNSICSRYKDR